MSGVEIVGAESTNLFVGTEADPRQVVRVRLRGSAPRDGKAADRVRIDGDGLGSEETISIGPLAAGEEAVLEIGVALERPAVGGEIRAAEVVVENGTRSTRRRFDFVAVEPGWRLFMVSHFHYDPVWWNTQAAYTETWGAAIQYRFPFQEPGLALVKAHLEMARLDPDYKFVLAELDYLKPYWDVYPEDRAYLRQLLADGRLELMGGTYNEPNTNLTSAESTIRNAIYGIGYQRDVLGGTPATAWQLDAFGHDPQFPGIMADAGITSSSWARGPFHEWGPHWVRGPARMAIADMAAGERPRMQFATEFDWVAPSGRGLLTAFMADHYSAGWWMDSSTTLEEAEREVHRLFTELADVAATRNVLLPVGTDYSPPNKWLTAIHRDWARRYVWPKFVSATPAEFLGAVRDERRRSGRGFTPQTRDMNPIYTGKDVSFIDTKQAQRVGENTLLSAEKFATFAALLGARFPTEAIDKAWRQLLFGAHHDGITGSESDQVYLDLLGGWREAHELGRTVLDAALDHLGTRIDTSGDGRAIVVFNPLSWARTDVVRAVLEDPEAAGGVDIVDDAGRRVPFVLESAERREDATIARATVAFLARDVPSLGYRTYRAVPGSSRLDEAAWRPAGDAVAIENETYRVTIDPLRGGAIESVVDKRVGKELVRPGSVANELLACREYPNHPLFAEGPWHLTPDGRLTSSAESAVDVTVEESAIGRRLRVEGRLEGCAVRQEIVLWDGVERIELRTRLDGYAGHDRLFRVRFPVVVEGGRPISEVGNAVVGRPFGFPLVDVAEVPFTLDHPAYNWFGLGATARVAVADSAASSGAADRGRAIGVAEVIVPDDPFQDEAVRRLVVALVRQGVTATVSRHDGSRYGVLHIDSNLPDVRLAVGRPDENRFVAEVLDGAGPAWAAELERQLATGGSARLWIPADEHAMARSEPLPDLRGVRDLPVLVVAGRDGEATIGALESLADDLGDAVVEVEQPAALGGTPGVVERYTVAVLNRGIPGCNVEADGTLYLSLMRSCSGWPSGVWIDPPHRTVPDGSNFQFQHWTHTFEYALAGGPGDWRAGRIVAAGHGYNNPLLARVVEPHDGELPATTSLLGVEPSSVVVTAVKPAGNPMARMAGTAADPADGLVARLYESSGRPGTVVVRSHWPLADGVVTNVTEEEAGPASSDAAGISVGVEPFEIVTLRGVPRVAAREAGSRELGPRIETAQPVFSNYWLHNKGPAPMGYQPVSVQIRPWLIGGAGPFRVPVVVASERTDGAVAGTVILDVPPGWEASPSERPFRLAPGAHVELDATVVPAPDARAGRYFVAARITDEAGQIHEDVVTIDLAGDPADGGDTRRPETAAPAGSRTLALAVARALRTPPPDGAGDAPATMVAVPVAAPEEAEIGGELTVEVLTREVRLAPGERGELRVALRNHAASEIRGEAQLISPHETWPATSPWTQGFSVGAGDETVVRFLVDPPHDFGGGTYWALVKVVYFGRRQYTESVPLVLPSPAAVGVPELGARPSRR